MSDRNVTTPRNATRSRRQFMGGIAGGAAMLFCAAAPTFAQTSAVPLPTKRDGSQQVAQEEFHRLLHHHHRQVHNHQSG